MKKLLLISFLSLFSYLCFSEESSNTSEEAEATLDPVESLGTSIPQNDLSTPINSTLITAQEISESGVNGVPELLSQKTTVRALTYSANPNDANLAMRGFSENSQLRVAVIVDGVRYNRADMANIPWLNIPVGNIESVELLRGANSARYGNNAVAGVVNIKTKEISKNDTLAISGMYGSYGTYSANAYGSISYDDYFATVNARRYYTDGYRDFSESWANNFGGSVGYFINENNIFKLNAMYSDSYSEYANPVSREEMENNPRHADSATTIYDSKSWTVAGNFERDSANSKGYANISLDTYDRIISATRTNDQYTLTFASEFEFELEESWKMYFGAEAQYSDISVENTINTNFYGNKLSYLNEDSAIDRINFGVHLGSIYNFTEALSLDMCVRADAVKTSADYIEKKHRLIFTPPFYEIYTDTNNSYNDEVWQKGFAASLALNYKIDKVSSVYAKFDQLFRYPSTDEIALYQGWGGAANMIKFNPDLKPEIGQNFEIGYKYDGENLKINSSIYALFLHDEIMYFPSPNANGTTVNDNVPDTMRLGADLYAAYEIKHAGIFGGASIIDARFIAGEFDGNDIPFVPHFNGFAGVFIRPCERVVCTTQLNYTSNQYPMSDLENTYPKVPSWWTLDIRVNFKLCDYANAYFAIDNIFDEHYTLAAVFGSYYPAMGRMFKLGLNLKF